MVSRDKRGNNITEAKMYMVWWDAYTSQIVFKKMKQVNYLPLVASKQNKK
jgi:hypothetical protein